MTVISKEQKSFKHYEEMPSELRIMVIDEMEPKDRILFSTSSKLSNIEAKKSKNYIYSFRANSATNVFRITVIHGGHKEPDNSLGFSLLFFDGQYSGGKRLSMVDINNRKMFWTIQLDDSMNMIEYGVKHFRNLMRFYQSRIKKLILWEPSFSEDVGCEILTNLEKLIISDEYNILQVLQKTRKPLKKIKYRGEDVSQNPQIMEYVFNMREKIYMTTLKLNDEQFSRLRASIVEINIGYLTERRIFDFIRSWQNGELGFELINYAWSTKDSNFRVRKLVTLLGAPKHNFKRKRHLKIHHNKEQGKYVNLSFYSLIDLLILVSVKSENR